METVQPLSVDFRLFQLEDRLQRLTKKTQTTLMDDLLKESQIILIPKLVLNINNRIDQFYRASEIAKNKNNIQIIVDNKIKQLETIMKDNILKQNQIVIEAEFKDIRNNILNRIQRNITSPYKNSKNTMTSIQFKQKINIVMSQLQQLNKNQKRNYQFTETIEKLSYDRIDEIRQMMKIAVQSLSNTKMQMAKTVTQLQISINKILLNSPVKQSRLGIYEQLSQQILKSLSKTQFQNIHLKKLNSEYEYLKDEFGVIKTTLNNVGEYHRYITKTVDKIQRFSNYLTQHQNRRQEIQKQNFKVRIQRLEANIPVFDHKLIKLDKIINESQTKLQLYNSNMIDISSSQNLQIKNIKDKLLKIEKDTIKNMQFKQQFFIPFRNQVNNSFRNLTDQIATYQLLKGQNIIIKQQLTQIYRALAIMDTKIAMFKQQFPTYRQSQKSQRLKEKQSNSFRYGKSVDQASKTQIRIKQTPLGGTRYSIKFMKSHEKQ